MRSFGPHSRESVPYANSEPTKSEPRKAESAGPLTNIPPDLFDTFMGRDALSLAISCLNLTQNDAVLLPVYTCQDVLKSFVAKCRVIFYDLNPDLSINPDHVRDRLRGREGVRMMLITNYFGFLQPCRDEIKDLCANQNICLIEDCAHSLLTDGSGSTGQLSIYSYRKILPIRDGGGLGVSNDYRRVVPKYRQRIYSDALSFVALLKSSMNVHTEKLSRARITSQAVKFLPLPNTDSRILPLSTFARHAIGGISCAEVAQKRRDDFQFWQEAVRGNPSITPLFSELPKNVCPMGFPLKTKNRESIGSLAKANGVSLRVHWRLDPNLGPECTMSHSLSKETLTLPLYPELEPKEREFLAELFSSRSSFFSRFST